MRRWSKRRIANEVVFDYTPGHSREFLGDYAGYLQADAYKGYDAIFAKDHATEVGCWAHTRRKFFDAQTSDPARAAVLLVLRMVAIGRKNWLFVGHDSGGRWAAIIYSLVASCRLCGIDPFAYLRDVLERINTHPAGRIAELLPKHWQSAQA